MGTRSDGSDISCHNDGRHRMTSFDLNLHPHRRFNPLTQEWVLVSPHRTQRPWQGQVERAASETTPAFDPKCYLCPGNARAGGAKNPQYEKTFAFENDFAALRPDTPHGELLASDIVRAESEAGRCRVVCFTPRHDLTLSRMKVDEIKTVIDTWCEEFLHLGNAPNIHAVQIFENRGEMMGCSNPHPHGQIWATETIPDELAREIASQESHLQRHKSSLLGDYLDWELQQQDRLVCSNDDFVVVVPFWAIWPFETLLISRRVVPSLLELAVDERLALADILRQVTIRYDNLFQTSFPYSMGFHQRPTRGPACPGFHLHAHFYPPLLRSATIRKFMVGFELLAMPQRDITPESAAARLRDVPSRHYLDSA